jgi:pimeloyl-ACP methyl ester carboxylesterase
MQWEQYLINDDKYSNQFYYKIGTGKKKLFLIHGYAESALIFEELVSYLREDFTIILPNIPGTSNTEILAGTPSISAMMDFCLHIVALEKLDKYFICGHSMGGYIALEILDKHSNHLLGFSLLNSHCYADDNDKKAKRLQAIELAQRGKAKEVLSTLVHSIYPDSFKAANNAKINEHIELAITITEQGVAYYNEAMMNRRDHSPTLAHAKLPISIFIADEDTTCQQDKLLAMSSLAEITDLTILRKCGHQGMVQYPAKVAAHMINYSRLGQILIKS